MTDTKSEGSRFAFNVPVRLYGPVVISPKPLMLNGKPKGDPEYSTRFFFPTDHPEAKAFAEILGKIKAGKFGKEAKVAYPFQMGDAWADKWAKKPQNAERLAKGEKNPRDFARGMVLCRASSKNFPPMLSYVNGSGIIDIPDEARAASGGKFYSGVNAVVEVNLVPYDGNGENIPDCVKAYLTKVCSIGTGDRLGGGSSAQAFAGLARSLGQVSDVDPTAGADLDDEIPF